MKQIYSTMTVEDESGEFDVEIEASFSPYRKATLIDPAEGGLEDVRAYLDGKPYPLNADQEDKAYMILLESME